MKGNNDNLLSLLPREKIDMIEKAFMQLAPSKEEAWKPESIENVKGALEIVQTKTPKYITLMASLIDLIDIPTKNLRVRKEAITTLYSTYFNEEYLEKNSTMAYLLT